MPEQPEVWAWNELPWRAWQELSHERQHVVQGYAAPMGAMLLTSRPLPIPWTSVMAWCDRAGVGDDERQEFVLPLISALDREYIAHWHRQQQKGQAPADDKLSRWDAED